MTEEATSKVDDAVRKFDVRLEVGRMAYEAGYFSQAARHYRLALDMAKESCLDQTMTSPALLGLAKSIAALGQFAEAERLIRSAILVDESTEGLAEEAEDYHQLSLLYWRSGRDQLSLELAERSWDLANRDSRAPDELKAKLLKHFAVLSEQAGELDECEKYLNKAIEFIELSSELNKHCSIYGDVLLVKVLMLAEQGRLAEAAELYSQAINVVEMNRGISHPRVHEVLELFQPFESGNIDTGHVDVVRQSVYKAKMKSRHGII